MKLNKTILVILTLSFVSICVFVYANYTLPKVQPSRISVIQYINNLIKQPAKQYIQTYTSTNYKLTFQYNKCYFGNAIVHISKSLLEDGCGSIKEPAELISFDKAPLFVHINQRCGIYYEASTPVFKKYQTLSKTGQQFDVYLHAYKNIYIASATLYNNSYSIEIKSKHDPHLYTNKDELENNIIHIVHTMTLDD